MFIASGSGSGRGRGPLLGGAFTRESAVVRALPVTEADQRYGAS